jgi:hypothetical protein
MNKKLTDEELESMGRKAKQMHEDAIELWKESMKVLPLASRQYKKICRAGRAVQDMNVVLWGIAEDRQWTFERMADVFSNTSCSFN